MIFYSALLYNLWCVSGKLCAVWCLILKFVDYLFPFSMFATEHHRSSNHSSLFLDPGLPVLLHTNKCVTSTWIFHAAHEYRYAPFYYLQPTGRTNIVTAPRTTTGAIINNQSTSNQVQRQYVSCSKQSRGEYVVARMNRVQYRGTADRCGKYLLYGRIIRDIQNTLGFTKKYSGRHGSFSAWYSIRRRLAGMPQ